MSYAEDEGYDGYDLSLGDEDEIPYWQLVRMVVALQKEIKKLRKDVVLLARRKT